MRLALSVVLGFLFASPAGGQPVETPAAALRRLVEIADPAARAQAARTLAARKDVTLDQWLAAARAFRPAGRPAAGTRTQTVGLRVLDKVEPTELHLHVPAGYTPGTPAPLLLAIHGTGGSGATALPRWRPVADALGMIVVAPSESGANVGYAFSDRERAVAFATLRWARRTFDIDENAVFCAGVSRGGHASWDLALRYPGTFAAIVPMVGGPRLKPAGGHNNIRFLEHVVGLPIRDLQGARDDPRLVASLRDVFARLETLKATDARLLEFPRLGHSFDFTAVDWRDFLGSARRTPVPARVVRLAARKGEGRAFWVEILTLDRKVKHDLRVGIPTRLYQSLDPKGRRAYVQRKVDEKTARLEVTMTAPGAFVARGRLVKRFRLLLTPQMCGPGGKVTVTFNGRARKKTARPSARVLLAEFAERFDRRFLPTAVVTVP